MKITWNFLGRGGCKTKKTSRVGSMDIFWNCRIEKKEVDQNNIIIIRPFKKKRVQLSYSPSREFYLQCTAYCLSVFVLHNK